MTTEERARLLALVADWEKATEKLPAVSDYDQGQLDSAVIILRQLKALLPPEEEAPRYGSEVLCEQCAIVFCPHAERGHFFHDGCPQCDA